jgi:putative transposase
MKDSYPDVTILRFCRLLGVTRQALYQHEWHYEELNIEAELINQQVLNIRKRHPIIGTRKLYLMLQPFLGEHQIKIGRDKLFDVLASYKLLVRRRKRKIYTTQSYHRFHKYPNLIKEMKVKGINQLWVSDITYFKIMEKFVYISFITDAYSHKIIGFQVAQTLETIHSLKALEMAIEGIDDSMKHTLTHHSDRGIQYCSEGYVKLLQDNSILISMTENGDPLENPIAERANGIIKDEYLCHYNDKTMPEIQERLAQVVALYNNERPHMSCNMLTPEKVHRGNLKVEKIWKTYYQAKRQEPVP